MKKALWAASLLLVAGTATACGSDGGDAGGAPEDASVEEFCKPFTEAADDAKVEDVADELRDVGTPEDIPDDARKGFEFLIENAEELDKNEETLDDEDAFKDKYGEEEFGQIEAFIEYFATTCAGELGVPTDVPTVDVPTLPTDIPTDDLPTIPTDDLPSIPTDDLPSIPELPESS